MSKQNQLGKLLESSRKRKKFSLRAVESRTGISNAYLSQLEKGKIKQPSPKILHKLGTFYEVSYGDLMQLAGYPIPMRDEEETKERLASRIGPLTENEEESLIEYLDFLRSRRGQS